MMTTMIDKQQIESERKRSDNIQNLRTPARYSEVVQDIVKSFSLNVQPNFGDYNVAIVDGVLQQHYLGAFTMSGRFAELLFADERIRTALETRASMLTDIWTPEYVKVIDSEYWPDQYTSPSIVATWWRKNIFNVLKRSALIRSTIDRYFMGFSVCQVVYDNDTCFSHGPSIEPWHPALTAYWTSNRSFHVITEDNGYKAIDNSANWWIQGNPSYDGGDLYRCWADAGLLQLAHNFLMKRYALADWARYGEQFGSPTKLALMSTRASEEQKTLFIESLKNLGPEQVIPLLVDEDGKQLWDLKFVEPKTDSSDVLKNLVDHCNKAFDVSILGTTSIIDSENAGAYNSTETRWRGMALSKARIDAALLEENVNELVKNVTKLLFGTSTIAPTIQINTTAISDTTGNRDVRLAKDSEEDV
jgi:hypothetical protein